MHLIDIGANLTHDSFDRDRDAVLDRARQAGVVQMVITGASREHSPLALQLAQQHPGFLYATAGVHPHHAVEYTEECDAEMRALHAHPEVVAVGECGLDYFRDFSPRPAQHRAFERQLQLAADNGKPLFLHQRDAHADFMAQMKNFEGRIGPAVVHCFTGERDELFDYLDQDWYIGITGWLCDERRGAHLRELVKNIPANRLMIETDAPYLLPRTLKPMPKDRRNEPMFLSHIVEELARDRGEDVAVTAANATAATRAFFRLPDAALPEQVAQALTVAGESRLPPQRGTRAATVDALAALVEAPQGRAQRRVIQGHGGWHRKSPQLRGEGQHVLRRCRLVIAGQVHPLRYRSLHRRDDHRGQILHVQAVEHQARAHHVACTPLRQLQQRIATRSVKAGQAQYRRGNAALLGQRTPLGFREPALHADGFSGVRHAGFVDPAAGTVGIHRGR